MDEVAWLVREHNQLQIIGLLITSSDIRTQKKCDQAKMKGDTTKESKN